MTHEKAKADIGTSQGSLLCRTLGGHGMAQSLASVTEGLLLALVGRYWREILLGSRQA